MLVKRVQDIIFIMSVGVSQSRPVTRQINYLSLPDIIPRSHSRQFPWQYQYQTARCQGRTLSDRAPPQGPCSYGNVAHDSRTRKNQVAGVLPVSQAPLLNQYNSCWHPRLTPEALLFETDTKILTIHIWRCAGQLQHGGLYISLKT